MQYRHMDDIYVCVSLGLGELEQLILDLKELKEAKKKNPELFSNNWMRTSIYQLEELRRVGLERSKLYSTSMNEENTNA